MSFWSRRRNEFKFPNSSRFSSRAAHRKFPASMGRAFQGRHLQIERLEDRCVLSVATVTYATRCC